MPTPPHPSSAPDPAGPDYAAWASIGVSSSEADQLEAFFALASRVGGDHAVEVIALADGCAPTALADLDAEQDAGAAAPADGTGAGR